MKNLLIPAAIVAASATTQSACTIHSARVSADDQTSTVSLELQDAPPKTESSAKPPEQPQHKINQVRKHTKIRQCMVIGE